MNFRKLTSVRAQSECGQYEIHISIHPPSGKQFFNAWHIPTGKHVGQGFSKAEVKEACERHGERIRPRVDLGGSGDAALPRAEPVPGAPARGSEGTSSGEARAVA